MTDRRDPLHEGCDQPVRWTSVNTEEAFTGVPTPLTWTICGPGFESFARGGFYAIGALRKDEVPQPADIGARFMAIHLGHVAVNLSLFRMMGDRIPGTSGDAVEAQIFGEPKSDTGSPSTVSRYPVVAVKFPVAAYRSRKLVLRTHRETDAWWRRCLHDRPADPAAQVARIADASNRFRAMGAAHLVNTMVAQGVYDRVRMVAASAGLEGLEGTLLTSWATEETEAVSDLWAVSRGRMPLTDFLAVHGFHGPSEGELSSFSWREDDSPLQALLSTYREMPDSAAPTAVGADRITSRDAALAELQRSLSRGQRAALRLLLPLARTYVPLRELGRNTFLKMIDVLRFTARDLGQILAKQGTLDDAEDVFYLTVDELGAPPVDAKELVAFRRVRRAEYDALQIPERWEGQVEPLATVAAAAPPSVVGLGASGGVVEGRARVMLVPGDEDLEPGEILVCRTTDPSWAAYFLVAGGVVIDIGGALSHGAIVAREMGIPCVINTRNGTKELGSGDLLRIDGTKGSVEVLERAGT